jgi:hypothetical protein
MKEPAAIHRPQHAWAASIETSASQSNAGSLELGKERLQYRLNVAQEENRRERAYTEGIRTSLRQVHNLPKIFAHRCDMFTICNV